MTRFSGAIESIEFEINRILQREHELLMGNRERLAFYEELYNRLARGGFYEAEREHEGESPGERKPNEAFMKATEEMWSGVEAYLAERHLALKSSIRELFKTSQEHGGETCDLRIFISPVRDTNTGSTVALLTLVAAHDTPTHSSFSLPKPFRVSLIPTEA